MASRPKITKYIVLRVLGGDSKSHFVVESITFRVWKLSVFLICNIGLFRRPGINPFACCYHRVPKYQILQDLLS